jgi:hypothetical protein
MPKRDERADVHNMLDMLEEHAPTWVRAIRRYVEKLEHQVTKP